jgi:hypothetical protein
MDLIPDLVTVSPREYDCSSGGYIANPTTGLLLDPAIRA